MTTWSLTHARVDADWHSLARDMCHRRFGVGADGLLLVLPSECADVRMRMFNPDGSEAEMCGNGIRCLVKYVLERGIASAANGSLEVETLAGSPQAGTPLERQQGHQLPGGHGRAGAYVPSGFPSPSPRTWPEGR